MKFYIVTPAYNALERLRGCIRSIEDQVCDGVEVHHHIQDGGSSDGTVEWLAEWQAAHAHTQGYTFTWESAKDNGMYDALNKAWDKIPSEADVTAHLNSDEQYCPHALQQVAKEMQAHPSADILVGALMVLDRDDHYHCHRRPVTPHYWSSMTTCEMMTCSTFHRVGTFLKHGVRCNTQYKAIADMVMFRDIMKTQPRVLVRPQLIIAGYAVTGSNLAWTQSSMKECDTYAATLPRFVAATGWLVTRFVNLRRRIVNCFCKQPKECSFYPVGGEARVVQKIERPTCIWRLNYND